MLRLVRGLIFVVAIPAAMIVGIVKGSRAMIEILNWPDDVCAWLGRISWGERLFTALLVIVGAGIASIATQFLWTVWHIESPEMYPTLGSRLGFSSGAFFIYLAGLAIFLIAIRRKRPPRQEPPKFITLS